MADDEDVRPCSVCESTETVEIHRDEQTISICAVCGSDQ